VAIVLKARLVEHKFSSLLILLLTMLMVFDFSFMSRELTLFLVVMLTMGVLATANERDKLASFLLKNKLVVATGKISFSLYMWHQVVLAFARYFWVQDLQIVHLIIIFILTVALSVFSYYLIENPFRNKTKINTKLLLSTLGAVFFLTSTSSLYIYLHSGVLKDIPELGIQKSEVVQNFHAKYNARVYGLDQEFISKDKIKVLVIGNSFARDWANVLMESKYLNDLEISYVYDPYKHKDLVGRAENADIIFYSTPNIKDVRKLGIPESKLWAVGTKNYGTSNGIFYNRKGANYFKQRTLMENGYLENNNSMAQQWGARYIDYIGKVIDENQTVPVFTPSNQFISQDCRHLTKAGAQYYSQLFDKDLAYIFEAGK